MREFLTVDPADLYLPPGRPQGADPAKLSRQIARYGRALVGMPPLEVVRCRDGRLRINDGVTRAIRAAKLRPGELVPIEVIETVPSVDATRMPRIKGRAAMTIDDDPSRDELFARLAELSRRYPHWRVGQLISNVAGWSDAEVWDVEDEQLLTAAEAHLAARREAETQNV